MKLDTSRCLSPLSGAIMMLLSCALPAAEHPLTQVHFDDAAKVNTIDMVMSIDWNIDAPPENRGKPFVENILKQTSQSLYTMTEGRVRLGKVSVYSNSQFTDNADIQYLLKDGRANASISGFNSGKGMTIQMFAGTNEPEADHGKTVAHELGHYLLGIFDEYREEGKKSNDPGDPQDGDTPRDTIMHNHLSFETISTPTDYADPATQNTAHYRVYKQSAWETVLSPPGNEPAGYPKRFSLQAFQGMTSPDATRLTKPKTGWESALQVVYMGGSESSAAPSNTSSTEPRLSERQPGPINVLVLDTSVAKPQLDAQINAAQQFLDAAGNNVSVMVYAYPYASSPLIPLTVVNTAEVKASIKAEINKIPLASAEDDMTNGDRLFDWAEKELSNLFPGGVKSVSNSGYYYRLYPTTGQAVGVSNGRVYYYDGKTIADVGTIADWLPKSKVDLSGALRNVLQQLKSVRTDADTPSVILLTTAQQTVDTSLAQEFTEAGISINPVALVTPELSNRKRYTATREASTSLYDLAEMTQGTFAETAKESELARDVVNAANSSEGDNQELVTDGWADTLAAGATSELTAQVATGLDRTVSFQAYWEEADEGKLSYTLLDPKGNKITPDTLPEGVTYKSEAGEGGAIYVVNANYPNHDGQWTSILTANAATTEAIFQEVTTDSFLFSELDVIGGSSEDSRPMVAVLELKGPLAVIDAEITADIYSATTGEAVKTMMVFTDDGATPDMKQGDGIYSVDLSSLDAGEYEMVAKVNNKSGKAAFSTAGSFKKGTNQPVEFIPMFERTAFFNFKKEL